MRKQLSTGACLKMDLAKSLPFSNDFPIKFPLVDFPWPRLPGRTKFQTHLDNCGDWLWLSDYKLLKEPLTVQPRNPFLTGLEELQA